MTFTKSFGYALRSIMYIAVNSEVKPKMQVEEIAAKLSVPKHFLCKIMKKVVQRGILNSTKGPHGGFSMNERTLSISLLDLAAITNSLNDFDACLLHLKECNPDQPCPLHDKMFSLKKDIYTLLANTSIGELMAKEASQAIEYLDN